MRLTKDFLGYNNQIRTIPIVLVTPIKDKANDACESL